MELCKVCCIGSTKGGVGKSTIAANLAAYLAGQDKKVLGIDADHQRSFSQWSTGRAENDQLKPITVIEVTSGLANKVRSLKEAGGYDYIVIDVGGQDSRPLREALGVSDILITPIGASQYDVWSFWTGIEELVDSALAFNPTLKSYLFANNIVPNTNDYAEVMAFFAENPSENFTILKSFITQKVAYKRGLELGGDVFSYRDKQGKADSKAIEAFNNFASEVFNG